MTVKQLLEKLSTLPPERSVVCQLVTPDGKALNLFYDFETVPNSNWAVQLRIHHPDLKVLPSLGDGWISCKTKMPSNGQTVLVKYEGVKTAFVAQYWFDRVNHHFNDANGDSHPATHWKPLEI